MRIQNAWRLLTGLSLLLTGCGKCCEVGSSSPSSTSTESASPSPETGKSVEIAALSCCEVEPSRTAVLARAGAGGEVDSKVSGTSAPDGSLQSGPQVGQEVPGPFHPVNVTGEQAGKKACLYCANGPNPVAVVFARAVTPQVTSLLQKLDDATQKNDKAHMGSFAVFCSDQEGLDGVLRDLAGKQGLKKLVLAIDNPAGPEGYHIAKDADVTVLLYNEFTVRSNYAFKNGELNETSVARVVADVSKIVPVP